MRQLRCNNDEREFPSPADLLYGSVAQYQIGVIPPLAVSVQKQDHRPTLMAVETLGQIMAAYDLQSLSAFTGGVAPPSEPYDWPVWNDEASLDERFIGYANALLPLCRPFHAEDLSHLERFARIGIVPGESFAADAFDEETLAALRLGVGAARAAMDAKVGNLGSKVNGWGMTEVFGNRAWYGGDHLFRAAGAMIGRNTN